MRIFKLDLLHTAACFAPPERARGAAAADDLPDDAPDDLPDDAPDDLPDDAPDDLPDDAPDDLPDDAPDDLPDDAPRGAGEPPPARRDAGRGRASDRIRTLAAERDDLKRRLDAMEERQRAPAAPAQQHQRTEAEEQAYLATMTVEERMEYRVNKALTANQHQTQGLLRNLQDQSDRAGFDAFVATNPKLKRYSDEVEARYQRVVREGGYLPRQAVLTYLIGERVVAKARGNDRDGRSAASDRVRRQQVRPGNQRGDVVSPRGRAGRTAEERLDGVPI